MTVAYHAEIGKAVSSRSAEQRIREVAEKKKKKCRAEK